MSLLIRESCTLCASIGVDVGMVDDFEVCAYYGVKRFQRKKGGVRLLEHVRL